MVYVYSIFFQGFTWPAAISLGAKWIPTCERSLFTNVFQGLSNKLGDGNSYFTRGFTRFCLHYKKRKLKA